MTTLVTVEGLAARLHKSVASVRSDATRNTAALPPICRLPNTKRLLWREQDIDQWLQAHVVVPKQQENVGSTSASPPRRGRPTKVEQRARRAEVVGARS